MGDVLSDLPEVNNYTTAEAAQYASAPQRPYQMWLRREPPAWQASAEERARRADEAMLASRLDQGEKQRLLTLLPGPEDAVSRGRFLFLHHLGTCLQRLPFTTCLPCFSLKAPSTSILFGGS